MERFYKIICLFDNALLFSYALVRKRVETEKERKKKTKRDR